MLGFGIGRLIIIAREEEEEVEMEVEVAGVIASSMWLLVEGKLEVQDKEATALVVSCKAAEGEVTGLVLVLVLEVPRLPRCRGTHV